MAAATALGGCGAVTTDDRPTHQLGDLAEATPVPGPPIPADPADVTAALDSLVGTTSANVVYRDVIDGVEGAFVHFRFATDDHGNVIGEARNRAGTVYRVAPDYPAVERSGVVYVDDGSWRNHPDYALFGPDDLVELAAAITGWTLHSGPVPYGVPTGLRLFTAPAPDSISDRFAAPMSRTVDSTLWVAVDPGEGVAAVVLRHVGTVPAGGQNRDAIATVTWTEADEGDRAAPMLVEHGRAVPYGTVWSLDDTA